MPRSLSAVVLSVFLVVACATSPLGRRQLQLFPDEQLSAMGVSAFQEIKAQTPQVSDPPTTAYVRCVADAITDELSDGYARGGEWEVVVFREDVANAFALPGGKIGVYTGLLDLTQNQSQLATVVGHEVAHVVAEHANERVSTAYATQAGLDLLSVIAGGSEASKQELFGLLGLGAQVGILLPFSRTQESEADFLGLDLMAQAGFDPRESVAFWEIMQRSDGGGPPEFLSTHPSGGTRIENLEGRMPRAMRLYEQARAQGKRPNCRPPNR